MISQPSFSASASSFVFLPLGSCPDLGPGPRSAQLLGPGCPWDGTSGWLWLAGWNLGVFRRSREAWREARTARVEAWSEKGPSCDWDWDKEAFSEVLEFPVVDGVMMVVVVVEFPGVGFPEVEVPVVGFSEVVALAKYPRVAVASLVVVVLRAASPGLGMVFPVEVVLVSPVVSLETDTLVTTRGVVGIPGVSRSRLPRSSYSRLELGVVSSVLGSLGVGRAYSIDFFMIASSLDSSGLGS